MSRKILHINEFGAFYGGTEQYIFDISNLLADAGFQNYILYSSSGGKNPEGFRKIFTESMQLDFESSQGLGDKNIGMKALEIFNKTKPDLIFFHRCGNIYLIETAAGHCPTLRMAHDHNLVCLRRHKFFYFSGKNCSYPAGIKCILNGCVIQKNYHAKFPPVTIKSLGKKLREIEANKKLTCILTASKFMRDELLCNGFQNNVKTLPLFSAPFAGLKDKPLLHSKANADKKSLLFVGEILRGKGLDLLLKALKNVKSDYILNVIGDGNALAKNKKFADDLGITGKVNFLGWIPHHELGIHFENCDLFAFPARWNEPFGLTGTEAMSMGKPVIAFNTGGISEWLWDGENGFLIEPNNTEQFAKKVDLLLRDEGIRLKMGERGREIYQSNFTPQKYQERLVPLINEIIIK